jgi:hypothetical protein
MKDKFMAGRFEPKDAWDHVTFTLHHVNYINRAPDPIGPHPHNYICMYLVCHVIKWGKGWRWTVEVARPSVDTWVSMMKAITLDEWK